MKRSEFIAKSLREVLLNGYWIANTNYQQQLLSVTWRQVADLNTIAALT